MAKKQKVRAAAVQIAPDLKSGAATLDRVIAAIDEAGGKGAEFIVFPETFVPWYPYFSFVTPPVQSGAEHIRLYEHAVAAPGPETDRVAAAARKHGAVVVLGINERDHGTLYNTQLVFDADGALKLKRRKITPTFHERMIWGQGDGSGLTVVDTAVGRVGALACWEHYNPLARYALMAQHEEIHAAQFPGSLVGPIFAEQIEAWRDSEVDQDHVGGLREVILDGGGGFSEVVLRKRSAVVSDIDRESFIEGLFVPRNKVAADDLIGEAAFAVKTNFYGVGFFGIDGLEDELVEQVVVFRSERKFFRGFSIEQDLEGAANVGGASFAGEEQRAKSHNGGLRGAPGAGRIFFGGDVGHGFARGGGGLSPL